jgi:hypothetical protein
LVVLIGALVWIGVALASAAKPVKGGIYQGSFGGPRGGNAAGSLTVSPNGRRVASVTLLPPECGTPPGPIPTIRNVPIVNGSFKAKYHTPTRPGIFNDATLTGHFLAHGRARGQEEVRSNETIDGSLCKYSIPWTAKAQPRGTKRCPDHAQASNIIVDGTTCAVVDKALNKGKIIPVTPTRSHPGFRTPGWTCRTVTNGPDNHQCKRSHPKKATFSFTE